MKRRHLLKALTGASAAMPLASILANSATAADGARPIRFLSIYHPNGCVPDMFHPRAGSLALPAMSSPLEKVKQHCVFMDGIGLIGNGSTHEGGAAKVLSGSHEAGQKATGSSIEVLMGEENASKGITPTAPSIQMGLLASKWSDKSISFQGTTRLPYQDDPLALYKSLFGGASDDGGAAAGLTGADNIRAFERAKGDLVRLQQQLGGLERERLEQHMSAFNVLESKLKAIADAGNSGTGGGGSCGMVNLEGIGSNDWRDDSPTGAMARVSDAQQDVAIAALSCDVTRAISFMYSHPVSPIQNPLGGLADHDASHANGETHRKSKVWWMQEIATFIEKMSNTPDGDGYSLLDNTIVLLCSELGHGNLHDHWRIPFVMAGGKGTGLDTGRSLDFSGSGNYEGKGASHADLLQAIARKAGYGFDIPLAKGELAGIW
ncbi:DUF1552 domain-containing protein [Marinagarivorans algicola]|uniref:DUF1552 domain-containing protein n=1 Tax=Marinagarivorans algicola TaxID=1513270 RepID=UPI0006B942C7|nr:DUF1552 domain-containing protein [Marinagarivorans algicola]